MRGSPRERDGQHHALAHPAGKAVGIERHALLRVVDADKLKQFDHARSYGAFFELWPVRKHCFGDLCADRHRRIKRGHRVLEHHGKERTAQRCHFALAISRNVRAVYDDLAGLDFCRLRQKAQDALAQYAFATARFADNGEHLARFQRKAHVAYRLRLARGGEKADGKVLDVQ